MTTDEALRNAKKAYDTAWGEAAKYGAEALDALNKARMLNVSDENNIFVQKAERATVAYENWRTAAENCAKVLANLHKAILEGTLPPSMD